MWLVAPASWGRAWSILVSGKACVRVTSTPLAIVPSGQKHHMMICRTSKLKLHMRVVKSLLIQHLIR